MSLQVEFQERRHGAVVKALTVHLRFPGFIPGKGNKWVKFVG